MKLIFDESKFEIFHSTTTEGLIITKDNYNNLPKPWNDLFYYIFEITFDYVKDFINDHELKFIYIYDTDDFDFNSVGLVDEEGEVISFTCDSFTFEENFHAFENALRYRT